MKLNLTHIIVGIAILVCSFQATAKLRPVIFGFDQELSSPRWMFEPKAKIKGPPVTEQLVKLRRAQINKKYIECHDVAKKLGGQAPGLKNWLAVVELDCAVNGLAQDPKFLSTVGNALKYVDQNPLWLINGPQASRLKSLYLEGQLLRFERQIKLERRKAWVSFDVLQVWSKDLNVEQKARMYRAGGELAFLEQNISLAVDLYARSLSEKESGEVRRKLDAVRSAMANKKDDSKPEVVIEDLAIDRVNVSGEKEISDRMDIALKSGDLISAVEDGVRLIEKIPGSISAKWASDRILEIYLSLGTKTEGNYPSLRERAVDVMIRADATRLYRWANNAYAKSFYKDAERLAEAAATKFGNQPESTKAILLAANSALYVGDLAEAEKWYERLVSEHGGSEESRQALFRLGLMRTRAKKWADASAYYERLLSIAPNTDWEYLTLYWHWRAQQKLKGNNIQALAERLVNKYPLTYYGLRARAELNGGTLTFASAKTTTASNSAPIKSEMWLSESQNQAWERLLLLLRAGWFDEAQAELEQLPEPLSVEDKLVRAKLLATAFDHYQAVKLFNEVWTKRPEAFQWVHAKAAFPFEYQTLIEQANKDTPLFDNLVRGLIRQESTFRPKATSAANAFGVMQLLPATAIEVAQLQKWKTPLILPDDLFNPETNIKLGSLYLSRLVKSYKGNVPLALAAYNAGTGRLRKWLAARSGQIGDIEGKLSSAPEDEIWIDELPWDETSAYVKAILRNLLIYEVIERGELKLPAPVWQITAP